MLTPYRFFLGTWSRAATQPISRSVSVIIFGRSEMVVALVVDYRHAGTVNRFRIDIVWLQSSTFSKILIGGDRDESADSDQQHISVPQIVSLR